MFRNYLAIQNDVELYRSSLFFMHAVITWLGRVTITLYIVFAQELNMNTRGSLTIYIYMQLSNNF